MYLTVAEEVVDLLDRELHAELPDLLGQIGRGPPTTSFEAGPSPSTEDRHQESSPIFGRKLI